MTSDCETCSGTGWVSKGERHNGMECLVSGLCWVCGGSGKADLPPKTVRIEIPETIKITFLKSDGKTISEHTYRLQEETVNE